MLITFRRWRCKRPTAIHSSQMLCSCFEFLFYSDRFALSKDSNVSTDIKWYELDKLLNEWSHLFYLIKNIFFSSCSITHLLLRHEARQPTEKGSELAINRDGEKRRLEKFWHLKMTFRKFQQFHQSSIIGCELSVFCFLARINFL